MLAVTNPATSRPEMAILECTANPPTESGSAYDLLKHVDDHNPLRRRRNGGPLTTHSFTLILAGVDVLTPEMGDALEMSGIDDAVMGSSGGVVSLGFDRAAEDLGDAVASAVRDLEKAGFKVARVEVGENGGSR
jgi:hypothetical protein